MKMKELKKIMDKKKSERWICAMDSLGHADTVAWAKRVIRGNKDFKFYKKYLTLEKSIVAKWENVNGINFLKHYIVFYDEKSDKRYVLIRNDFKKLFCLKIEELED